MAQPISHRLDNATMLRRTFFSFGVFFLFCALFHWLSRPFSLRVVACDIGQGDAFLGVFGMSSVLIDTGPNQAVLDCLAKKLPFGQRKLSAVVLTHGDLDHIGGFSDIASTYTIGEVFANPKTKVTKVAQEVWDSAEQLGVQNPFPGDELIFPGGRLRFVWSSQADYGYDSGSNDEVEENPLSIATLGVFKSFGFLDLGDLECEQELAVSSLPLLTSSPILKVSHHGSKSSSCLPFLAKIRPEIALASVGRVNKYGHPHPDVVKNMMELGIPLLRTDRLSSLEIKRGENGWIIQTEQNVSKK